MRLIDADALPKLLDAEYKQTKKLIREGEKHLDTLAEGFAEAAHIAKYITPTVDAVPVVHGRWNNMDGYKMRKVCSECGWDVPEYGKFYSYCPNCGAKMDGVDNNEAD